MALVDRTEVGVREIGRSVSIPNNPRARLMYYLRCMTTVLDLDDDLSLSRLTNYSNHFLSEDDTTSLVTLCLLLSPEILLNKCIFLNEDMCGSSGNKFYEISAVQQQLLVTRSVVIGGQQRAVHKIMTFKMSWLKTYWTDPIKMLMKPPTTPAIERDSNNIRQPLLAPTHKPSSGCCGCDCCNCNIL